VPLLRLLTCSNLICADFFRMPEARPHPTWVLPRPLFDVGLCHRRVTRCCVSVGSIADAAAEPRCFGWRLATPDHVDRPSCAPLKRASVGVQEIQWFRE
jgi:hypothetical protein